jgi:hypothetical protein
MGRTLRHAALLAVTALAALAVVTGGSGAAFTAQTDNPGNSVTAAPDFVAPTVSATVIAKEPGSVPGYVKLTGSYRVYANVSDTGNPASGVATVTADVSNLTLLATAVSLSSGSWTVGGQSYNYRSAAQTVDNAAASGVTAYTITASDNASNSGNTNGSVTVDNTAPTASDVQAANVGSTAGKAEATDTVTLTYSEPIDPESVLAGWDGTSTSVVVRITNGGLIPNDTLTVFNAADTSQLPLGSVDLGRTDYVGGGVGGGEIARFGATGTASTMVMSGSTITLTLGTASGEAATTAAATGTMIWTPSTSAYDRAGNAALVTVATESGGADKEF